VDICARPVELVACDDRFVPLGLVPRVLLERAVQDGDARVQHWAHLYDRTLVNSGRPQEFGTQQVVATTGVELCPVRALDSLDHRRATVGLSPIAMALETVRRRFALDHQPGDSSTVVLAAVA